MITIYNQLWESLNSQDMWGKLKSIMFMGDKTTRMNITPEIEQLARNTIHQGVPTILYSEGKEAAAFYHPGLLQKIDDFITEIFASMKKQLVLHVKIKVGLIEMQRGLSTIHQQTIFAGLSMVCLIVSLVYMFFDKGGDQTETPSWKAYARILAPVVSMISISSVIFNLFRIVETAGRLGRKLA